jgi:nicotinamide mononucleotide transporter
MSFFSVENIALTVFNYPLSFVELTAILFGLVSVFLASRSNVLTWPTGILNECSLFLLFFQVQLYADMFLQVFFLLVTLYGWYYWNRHVTQKNTIMISQKTFIKLLVLLACTTIFVGSIVAQLHELLPTIFQKQAASPYIDSFVTTASIIATFLLAKKILQTWIFWIIVDVVSIGLFFSRGIYFVALEYVIFLAMAFYGYFYWRKNLV